MLVDGKKIYLVTLEAHVGEYGQIFKHTHYAKDVTELETAIDTYLTGYYGEDEDGESNMTEKDGNTYCYFNGECTVAYVGYTEIQDLEQLVREIYM